MLSKDTIRKLIGQLEAYDERCRGHNAGDVEESKLIRRSIMILRRELADAPRVVYDQIPFDDIEQLAIQYEALWHQSPYSLGEPSPPPCIAIVRDWIDRETIPF